MILIARVGMYIQLSNLCTIEDNPLPISMTTYSSHSSLAPLPLIKAEQKQYLGASHIAKTSSKCAARTPMTRRYSGSPCSF